MRGSTSCELQFSELLSRNLIKTCMCACVRVCVCVCSDKLLTNKQDPSVAEVSEKDDVSDRQISVDNSVHSTAALSTVLEQTTG